MHSPIHPPVHPWHSAQFLSSPLFAPLHHLIRALDVAHFPTLSDHNRLALHYRVLTASGLPLRFVEQQYGKLPFELQYEPRCYLQGEVPTRSDNWHDLFNALVWFAFPRSKAVINQRHYRALTSPSSVENYSQRGSVRDVNTLFDESGIVIVSSQPELLNLIRQFCWAELFCQQRAAVQQHMGFFIFGHSLYEKALSPYVGLTAHAILLEVDDAFFSQNYLAQLAQVDTLLADNIDSVVRTTQELAPFPLLGVPGWYSQNEQFEFYNNTSYFRTGRRVKTRNSQT